MTHTPTLTTATDATSLLRQLAETHDWVSVFWDRGWGDSGQTAEISIITGGNGSTPHAHITANVYTALVKQGVIGANSYGGYKDRRIHDFKTRPVEEPAGPRAADVFETLLRSIMDAHPEWPIRAEFYRGMVRNQSERGSHVRADEVFTPAFMGGWYVNMVPGCAEVAVAAMGAGGGFFGSDILGERGIADCLPYPTCGGEVDVEALAGDGFRAVVKAEIRAKLALIGAEQAKAGAR